MANTTPAIPQEEAAWRAGYAAGLRGESPPSPPAGLDGLSFFSGLIEGKAARENQVVRLQTPFRSPKP